MPFNDEESGPLLAASESAVRTDYVEVNKYGSSAGDMSESTEASKDSKPETNSKGNFMYYIIYALVNSIMCIPCLYGYASVIFNNDAFIPHINALSKLVLWSSTIHQFCFCFFSSLPFSIGQVQDAGLIFLSHMANTIANDIASQGGSTEEILSTTLVLLSMATASLGLICILMGRFKLADAVGYLPLPVVGGYLAFIGYFCVQAGVSLCISQPMMGITGWLALFNRESIMLAIPGIIAGALLVFIARKIESDAALPLAMVCIPGLFYIILFACGSNMENARLEGWVGEASPPVPVTDLFTLIDITKVHWGLVSKCLSTWLGMVLVVSFSSCLDVAAISMDMGEALNTNAELMTVGISNVASGLTVGFTGSYIFSQTIFTYRTGTNSRWVGFFVALSFLGIVLSTVNVLQVTPLFFLGSTLIFIGTDLLFEWLVEIRHKLLQSEYAILWVTFVCIQILGINAGIVLGVIMAVIVYVVSTVRVSSVERVTKHSRRTWTKEQRKLLQGHGYNMHAPKIVTLEFKGTIFFGSAMEALSQISDAIALKQTEEDMLRLSMASPGHRHASAIRRSSLPGSSPEIKLASPAQAQKSNTKKKKKGLRFQPRYVVLDLFFVPSMDSSAARGCFLQLARMCAQNNILLCASGANSNVESVLRAHEIAYSLEEEEKMKTQILDTKYWQPNEHPDRIILFKTLYEALGFCEINFLDELDARTPAKRRPRSESLTTRIAPMANKKLYNMMLGKDHVEETRALIEFEESHGAFHTETEYMSGGKIFEMGKHADAFYIVLSGSVGLYHGDLSGGEVDAYMTEGNVFGFVDFMMDQQCSFSAAATEDGTVVATFHRDELTRVKAENPALTHIITKFLLQASILELANVSDL